MYALGIGENVKSCSQYKRVLVADDNNHYVYDELYTSWLYLSQKILCTHVAAVQRAFYGDVGARRVIVNYFSLRNEIKELNGTCFVV